MSDVWRGEQLLQSAKSKKNPPMGELGGDLGLSLCLRLSYENTSIAWDAASGYILQEEREVKEKMGGKSWAHLCSRTSLSFALKPAGLLGWLVEGADVLMSLHFNQAACLVPALTGLQTKYFLSLPCGEHCLANVICQVNQGEWALRWLLDSLATLPWKQAAKQLVALLCSAEIWHEKPILYLPSTKQLAEDASSFSRLTSRDWKGSG